MSCGSSPLAPHHRHYCLPQIRRVKERVEEKQGIPPEQQRLIFSGKQMYANTTLSRASPKGLSAVKPPSHLTDSPYRVTARNDEKTITDYKVVSGSILHLVLALRGGY